MYLQYAPLTFDIGFLRGSAESIFRSLREWREANGPTRTVASQGGLTEALGTIEMSEDGYLFPEQLETGWYHVKNTDTALHELSLLRLDRDLDDDATDALVQDLADNKPPSVKLDAVGGMGAISPGFDGYLYLDLEPLGVGTSVVHPGFVQTPLTAQNNFTMPALITPEQAAQDMIAGWARGEFEIHYPKRFTRVMKLLSLLPYRAYFPAVRRFTGL